MNIGKYIFGTWAAMFGALIICVIFNMKIILIRAFVVGIIVLAVTIIYVTYGWYREWKNPGGVV